MKKIWLLLLLVSILSVGCAAGTASSSIVQADSSNTVVEATSSDVLFTDVDNTSGSLDQEITETSVDDSTDTPVTSINLSDYMENSVVSIETAGDYLLSGTLSNGQIVVNVGDDEKVKLYLNNATITNNNGSVIVVQNAGKVVITLNEGTVNTITDGVSYANLDESGEPDAAIFSHDDLTINGSGSLTVYANYSDGIESRDDLKITGGNITVISVDSGLFGNNSFEMKEATVEITSGGDTIHSDGDILIESGTITINSGDDGIHADGALTINDGTIDVQSCYEGLEATDVIVNGGVINIVSSDDGINGAGGNDNSGNSGGGPLDQFSSSVASITINGGTITVAAGTSGNGDGLDANGTITITGGDTVIKTPATYRDYTDIDYNTTFTMTGGSVRILNIDGTYTTIDESNVGGGGPGGIGFPDGGVPAGGGRPGRH